MTIRIEPHRITSTNIQSSKIPLFSQPNHKQQVLEHDDAQHITNNIKMGKVTKLIYHSLDILNPLMQKHPKLCDIMLKYSEKILKIAEKL